MVAMAVVDLLEPVYVDVEQGEQFAVPVGAGQETVERLDEQRAVGQASQQVVRGLVAHLLLDAAPLGDLDLQLLIALLQRGQRLVQAQAAGLELEENLYLG